VILAVLISLAGRVAHGENINPAADDSKYAWSENMGWINAQPSGPGGPGVQVSDVGLTGYAWSENAGWISLSCTNQGSCGTHFYGVSNNGCGTLTGYAWSENAGWIVFSPTGAGVSIDPLTGIFSGRAWSENAGWITFSSTGPNPYRVATSWRAAVPTGGVTGITVHPMGSNRVIISWVTLPGASRYDVVAGRLSVLRSTGGNFQAATQFCVDNDVSGPSTTFNGNPGAGDAFWFLVRGENCGAIATYDDGSLQQFGPRDALINSSANSCP
jgi:hypothetical protein